MEFYKHSHSKITLTEKYVNMEVLNDFTNMKTNDPYYTYEMLKKADITSISKLLKYVKNNEQTVIYEKRDYNYGRFYPREKTTPYCLQSMKKELRHILLSEKAFSIDLSNAHPTILIKLCKTYSDMKCVNIMEYTENRNIHLKEICDKYQVNRCKAKELMLILTFGGSFKTWMKENKYDKDLHTKHYVPSTFVTNYSNEIQEILCNHALNFPEFETAVIIASRYKGKKGHDALRSALGLYLQNAESEIMMCMYDYILPKFGRNKVCALIHDEFILYGNENELNKEELEAFIESNTPFDCKIESKNFNADNSKEWIQSYQRFFKQEDLNLRTDLVHSINILKHFEGKIFSTGYGQFIYDEDKGSWSNDSVCHHKIIMKYATQLITNVNEGDEKKPFITLYNNAMKSVWAEAPRKMELPFENNLGYLLFDNCVLDMYSFTMKDFSPDYYFTKKINRDYDTNIDRETLKQEIIDKLFNTAYTIPNDSNVTTSSLYPIKNRNVEKRNYILETLARASALGGQDKEFSLIIGDPDCGKGVLTKLTSTSLDEYFDNFNSGNLIAKGAVSAEDEKKWAWVAPLWDRRIVIANEFQMDTTVGTNNYGKKKTDISPINGGMMKTLVSQGDEIKCRLVYEKTIKIKSLCYYIVLANDVPPVNGVDAGYISRANYLIADRNSSSNVTEETTTHFPKDKTITEYVKRTVVADAFIEILCEFYKLSVDTYKNTPYSKTPKPSFVLANIKEMVNTNNTGIDWVNNNYIVYKGDVMKEFVLEKTDKGTHRFDWNKVGDNWVLFDTMYEWYKNDGNTDSTTKFGKMLTNNNILTGTKKINGRTRQVRVGLKRPNENDDNNELEFRDDNEDEDDDDDLIISPPTDNTTIFQKAFPNL